MLWLRDLGLYLKRLVTHDWLQEILVVVTLVELLVSLYNTQVRHNHFAVAPDWSLLVFGVVLMAGGFRLWRDERLIAEHEGEQLRAIARRMRGEIETQEGSHHRMFSYAENPEDRRYHERMFQKHLPKIAEVAEAWLVNPDARDAVRATMNTKLLTQMPEGIPEPMRWSVANAICSYVEASLFFSVAPEGWFSVATGVFDTSGEETKCLRLQECPDQSTIFSAAPNLEGIDQIAVALNELSQTAWNSTEGKLWRELLPLNWRNRGLLSDYLTDVINGCRLTRKHCDKSCFELLSGD